MKILVLRKQRKQGGSTPPCPFPVSLLFALLIGDGARGLAGGLAGSLAFAAAALSRRGFEILLVHGLNVFHFYSS